MINQGMIDQGAQALAERIGKLDADLFRGAAEAVLRAALSDKPSPGDRTRTGETARGEACDLAPPPSTHMQGIPTVGSRADLVRCLSNITRLYVELVGHETAYSREARAALAVKEQSPAPQTNLRLDVDRLAARIVTAACELDGPADPVGDDTISITMKDLEAVVHRHVTVALEETR